MNFLKGKAIFVPAMSHDNISKWKANIMISEHDTKFFTEKSFFKYNFILASSYYQLDANVENFRQQNNYPIENTLIIDSSGYQVASFARKGKPFEYTPLQILRWMEANADIGMSLDVPPWDNFNAALKQSLENFSFFEKNRLNYDMKLYNILHGKTLDEMKHWYNAVKDFPFDGWALGVRPSDNIYLQTIGYMFLQEMDAPNLNTNFHMFGISGLKNMLTMPMLSTYFNSMITFDSSSYDSGTRFRRFCFPKDVRFSTEFGRSAKKSMKSIPCNCPVCRNITIEDLYRQDGPTAYLLLPLHNLYQYIEVNRMTNAIVTDDHALDEYAASVNETQTINTIRQMFKSYEEEGCEKTYNKFKHLMTLRCTDTKASNLFSVV